ncbi:MAG: class I SAM-dependent methyltransferase [Geitlerinemataceae cyanobacterium]
MLQRVLEPEVMDTWEESVAYDAMDFLEVNTAFAEEAVALGCPQARVLDAGTGPARIPVLMSQRRPQWQIVGIDLSENMLKLGTQHIREMGLADRIQLQLVDAKRMPFEDNFFDMVVSNSIVHHIPNPLPFFQEIQRVLKPNSGLFLRDLRRPPDIETVDRFVASIGEEYDTHQTQLFRDSLIAAFTVEEVREMLDAVGLEGVEVYASSDRHWTAKRSELSR